MIGAVLAALATASPDVMRLSAPALTLPIAARQAVAASALVRAAEARWSGARSRTAEVWASVYPQVSLGASVSRFDLLGAGTSMAPGGLGGSGSPSGLSGLGGLGGLGGIGGIGGASGQNQLQGTLSVNQVLFDGFRTQAGLDFADITERLGRVDVEGAKRKAAFGGAMAFITVMRAEALAGTSRNAVDQARRHLETARIRLGAGAGMQVEVLQAQAALATARGQEIAIRNSARKARTVLSAALGRDAGESLEAGSLPKVEADPDRVLPEALAHRLESVQLDLKIGLDKAQVTLQERANWPNAAAYGQLAWPSGGGTRYDVLGVQASWPLIDAGKTSAKVAQAQADLAADEATREALLRDLETEIRAALHDRQEARERLTVGREGLDAAREAARLAEVRFRAGAGTGYDVLDAQAMLAQAEVNVVGATYDIEVAELKVLQALGLSVDSKARP